MINSGVYQIINKVNGHRYVGSSAQLDVRKAQHFKALNNGDGSNPILKNVCSKYGIDNLEFQILLYCDPENRIMYEQMILDAFKPYYNICQIAGLPPSRLGIPHSNATKQKLSDAHSGKKLSKETKQKIGDAKRGKKFSEEHKQKLSDAHIGKSNNWLGRKHSEESKQKMSNAQRGNTSHLGHVHSEESKQKIGDASRGRKHSEETKRKIGDAHIGRKCSEEAKQKMSVAKRGNTYWLGKKHSEESKKKMSDAAKEAWKRRKMNELVKL